DEPDDRADHARPQQDPETGLADEIAEAVAKAGIDKGPGDDPEKGGHNEGRQSDPDQCRNEVDEPERDDEDQPQDQQIVERVRAKPGFELADERPRALGEPTEAGPGGEKTPGGPQRSADDRAESTEPGSEQKTAGNRQHGRTGNRQRDKPGIGRDVEKT